MDKEDIVVIRVPLKLSWGAIFGGTFVAAGVWILLYTFGLALGVSMGMWSFIAPVLALFVGGLVTARCAGFVDRASGAIHGAVMWGLTMLAGTILIGIALSSLLGSMVSYAGFVQRGRLGAGAGILWAMFLSLLFGLGASMLGATAGVSRKQRLPAPPTAVPPPSAIEPALR
jgi:hypothetical protein